MIFNKQIFIYAFPVNLLKKIANEESKTPLEELEDFEILRFLEIGFDIRMIKLSGNSFVVYTPDDLRKIRKNPRNGFLQYMN